MEEREIEYPYQNTSREPFMTESTGFSHKIAVVVSFLRHVALAFEILLAVVMFLGIVRFGLHSMAFLYAADWALAETIYDLIYRVLLVVIALELIRTLLTHELEAVLEMLAFVVARKTLKPDLTVSDIFLSVLAFVILLAGRRYLITPAKPVI
jgi:hypothetical protein